MLDGYRIDVSYAIVQRTGGYRPSQRTSFHPRRVFAPRAAAMSSFYQHSSLFSPPDHSSTTVIISNLPPHCTADDVFRLLSAYDVLHIQRSDSIAVAILRNKGDVDRVRRDLDLTLVNGQWQIRVQDWLTMQNEHQVSRIFLLYWQGCSFNPIPTSFGSLVRATRRHNNRLSFSRCRRGLRKSTTIRPVIP